MALFLTHTVAPSEVLHGAPSILGPLLAGQVADRWWPAERCVTVLAFTAGVVAWLMAEVTSPATMFVASLAFWVTLSKRVSRAERPCVSSG